MDPLYTTIAQSNPQPTAPDIQPQTGQEEYLREQPLKYDPNERQPSEMPQIPGEGPQNPEEPANVPPTDPNPSRGQHRIGFRYMADSME